MERPNNSIHDQLFRPNPNLLYIVGIKSHTFAFFTSLSMPWIIFSIDTISFPMSFVGKDDHDEHVDAGEMGATRWWDLGDVEMAKSPLVITDSKAEPFDNLLSNGENLLCASLSEAVGVPRRETFCDFRIKVNLMPNLVLSESDVLHL